MATRAPQAPAKLGAKAKKIWTDTVKKYDLRTDELRLLEDACREVDTVERLQKDIDAKDFKLRAKGSMGQPVIAPELDAIVKHRAAYQRAMLSLKLPEDEDKAAEQRSTSARDAANARWRKGA